MNIYDTPLDKLPIKEIKAEYINHYDMINKTCCFGTKDVTMLYKLENELYRRGYTIEEDVKIYKED